MEEHSNRREYYNNYIYAKHERTCKGNIDNPYCVRGDNRKRLLSQGKEVTYDRVAILFTSCTVLWHTHSDVSVEHYIVK